MSLRELRVPVGLFSISLFLFITLHYFSIEIVMETDL
jgi:hypothetical protein